MCPSLPISTVYLCSWCSVDSPLSFGPLDKDVFLAEALDDLGQPAGVQLVGRDVKHLLAGDIDGTAFLNVVQNFNYSVRVLQRC